MKNPQSSAIRILIIEHDLESAKSLAAALEAKKFQIAGIGQTMDDAIHICSGFPPDVAIVDLQLNDSGSGEALTEELQNTYGIPVILGADRMDEQPDLPDSVIPHALLFKPYHGPQLETAIYSACANRTSHPPLSETILNRMEDAVVVTDAGGTITYCNATARNLIASEDATPTGAPFLSAFHLTDSHNIAYSDFQDWLHRCNHRQTCAFFANSPASTYYYFEITPEPAGDEPRSYIIQIKPCNREQLCNTELHVKEKALEQTSEMVIITDAEHEESGPRIRYVNRAFTEITGYTPEEVKGQTPRILQGPETDRKVLNDLKAALEKGEHFQDTAINYKKNGSPYRVLWNISPVRNQSDEIIQWISVQKDITEEYHLHRKLEQSELKLRTLLQNSSDCVTVIDADYRIVFQAGAGRRLLGISPEHMEGSFFTDYIHPEDQTKFREAIRATLQHPERSQTIELQIQHQDGGWRYFQIIATNQYPEPIIGGIVLNSRDITEQNKHEEVLRTIAVEIAGTTGNTFFHSLSTHLTAMLTVDYVMLLDYPTDDPQQSRPLLLTEAPEHDSGIPTGEYAESLHNILQQQEVFIDESDSGLLALPAFKERGIQAVAGARLWDRNDRIIGAMIIFSQRPLRHRHITEWVLRILAIRASAELQRYHYEKELTEAKEKAEEMNRLKSSFLSNMSHEIRTPMNTILGFASLLYDEEAISGDLQMYVDRIHGSGKRLLEIIDGLLDLAKIEANRIELNFKPLDLEQEIKQIADQLSPLASAKGLSFHLELPGQPCFAGVDQSLFSRIVNNLIGNAIKFTDEGEVRIKLYSSIEDSVVLEVSDTGVGINKDFLPNIYNSFEQESSGLNRNYEGIGLGLTITRKYVELLGGSIEVATEKGKGTTFRLTFARSSEDTESSEEQPSAITPESADLITLDNYPKKEATAKKRLLVVDDHLESQEIIHRFLHQLHEVDITSDETSAMRLAHLFNYDAFIIDINLGIGQSGVNLMKQLRNIPACRERPMIAVTAHAMQNELTGFLDEGFDDYLTKPFEKQDLFEILTRSLQE